MQQDAERPQYAQAAERDYSGYQAEPEGYRPRDPEAAYGAGPMLQGSVKIHPTSSQASAGQRLALAIVSVSILGLLGMIIGSNSAVGFGGYIVLGIITLALILINAFFNHWGGH